ncbi:MAG: UDP-N-acetylmuramoyl-L-alanine--D-glutamate ligase [Bacteroidia bacterium]|nr:UDP-N-acetylmuramoyl-L-alanine--D-glutamate ligase [Bacteroidia bacterium]MDW8235605.1 UDP-N-acetylmuramoyl-L-alanine--D-glutamate ligase [Bacteroidia bacterium]
MIGIWGLGESGTGAALLASAKGYPCLLVAEQPPQPAYAQQLRVAGLSWHITSDPVEVLQKAELIVRSPGIRPQHPSLLRLRAKGIPIISDLEWGWRHFPSSARLWLVTGTSGKSSTTSLLAHTLRTAGKNALACGNIGYSFCQAILTSPDYFVVEASSFQLWDTFTLIPHLMVVTGLSYNHIDWHGDFAAYADAKLHIVERLPRESHLLLDGDSVLLERALNRYTIQAKRWVYRRDYVPGTHAWIEGDQLVCDMQTSEDTDKWEVSYEGTPLQELPQRKNALAAAIASQLEGLRRADLRRSFETFQKLPHRLEQVDYIDGVLYVNDSKATTTDAIWYSMQSLGRPVVWIAGGVDKGTDWGELMDVVRARVRALVLIGKDTRRLEEAFREVVPLLMRASSMEDAVEKARSLAQPGDVVLLAPGCASFDWYSSYEERGEAFRRAVQQLKSAT